MDSEAHSFPHCWLMLMFRSLGIQGLVQGVGDASSHPLAHSPSLTDSLGCWSFAHSLMDSFTLLLTFLLTHGLTQALINSSCVDSHVHLVPQLTVNLLTHLHTPHLTNIVPLVFTKTQSFTNLLRHSFCFTHHGSRFSLDKV